MFRPSGVRSIICRHAEALCLGVHTVYGLRHAWAQSILDQGYRIEDVAAFLGHKNLITAQGYAQVRADRVRELAQNLASPVPADKPKAKRTTKRTG